MHIYYYCRDPVIFQSSARSPVEGAGASDVCPWLRHIAGHGRASVATGHHHHIISMCMYICVYCSHFGSSHAGLGSLGCRAQYA